MYIYNLGCLKCQNLTGGGGGEVNASLPKCTPDIHGCAVLLALLFV